MAGLQSKQNFNTKVKQKMTDGRTNRQTDTTINKSEVLCNQADLDVHSFRSTLNILLKLPVGINSQQD